MERKPVSVKDCEPSPHRPCQSYSQSPTPLKMDKSDIMRAAQGSNLALDTSLGWPERHCKNQDLQHLSAYQDARNEVFFAQALVCKRGRNSLGPVAGLNDPGFSFSEALRVTG